MRCCICQVLLSLAQLAVVIVAGAGVTKSSLLVMALFLLTPLCMYSGLEYVQLFIQHTHCRPSTYYTHLPDHELIKLVCAVTYGQEV